MVYIPTEKSYEKEELDKQEKEIPTKTKKPDKENKKIESKAKTWIWIIGGIMTVLIIFFFVWLFYLKNEPWKFIGKDAVWDETQFEAFKTYD